jgi:hypothetical protein
MSLGANEATADSGGQRGEFQIGDQVRYAAKCANPRYNPGIGTVTNITPKAVVVRWNNRPTRQKPHPYKAANLGKVADRAMITA